MKKINTVVPNIALFIATLVAFISGVATYCFIAVTIAKASPELYTSLDRGPCTIVGVGILLVMSLVSIAITYVSATLFIAVANWILQCDITHNTDYYPKEYYIAKGGYTDNDRRYSARMTYRYRKSYTVVLEVTTEEMTKILEYMELYRKKYYEFRKSFLMPDHVTCLHPEVSLRTVRRIMRSAVEGGTILLKYRCRHPKNSQIRRTDDSVRIVANLHQPTYSSTGIIVSRADDEDYE